MKKLLLLLSFVFSTFLFSSFVLADTLQEVELNNFYRYFDDYVSEVSTSNNKFDKLLNAYNGGYYNIDYPYYIIVAQNQYYYLYAFQTLPSFDLIKNSYLYNNQTGYMYGFNWTFPVMRFTISTNPNTNTVGSITYNSSSDINSGLEYITFVIADTLNTANTKQILDTNMDLVINSISYNNNNVSEYFQIPTFTSSITSQVISSYDVYVDQRFPTYRELYDDSYEPGINYTTINLNSYPYVALSLRNYELPPNFTTQILTKGQLCLTPVYNYGMKEKNSYSMYTGLQNEPCSPIYDNFTPVRVTLLESDFKYHAIYYLKAYDTTIENVIKVDSSLFDVTYITSQNELNPSVTINGRTYPTIPYDNLSSSATVSEEEGYVPGVVRNVFDISSDSNFITGLFTNPLQTLGNVWTSIITMFTLVGNFIGLLPQTLQFFLYTGFSLAIVLGVIKILL